MRANVCNKASNNRRIHKTFVAVSMLLIMLAGHLYLPAMIPQWVPGDEIAAAPLDAKVVSAPDIDLHMYLWLQEEQPYYSVVYKGKELVAASRMGLETSSAAIGSLSAGFTGLTETSADSRDSTWAPIVGEKAEIHDKYNEKIIRLDKGGSGNLSIEMRAYNTGVAFRYLLPDADEVGNYSITEEQTRFNLAPEGDILYHNNGQQTVASKARITNIPSTTIYPPMTAVFDDGTAMTVAVANLDQYVYGRLRTNAEGRLKPTNERVNVTVAGPAASTYWTFVIGDSLADLPNNKDIILNLNNAPDEEKYGFNDWVEPGKAWMMGLFNETTATMKDKIDLAKELGLEYLLMDFGWYGPEFYRYSDPRLDPTKLVADPGDSAELAAAKAYMRQYVTEDGVFNAAGKPFNVYLDCPWGGNIQMQPNLNVPEIINYANTQGVGIFLYVNNVQLYDTLNRFTVDELFAQFAKWGVKGVKPGFVANKSQAGEGTTRQLVETAAKHKLMLTIHDDWIQTGIEREFPNLLTAEGVYGDEGISASHVEGDLNALFARGLQGFADHTICYPGKATRGFQLASSVLWPTGLNCVYWPWRNTDTGNQATMESLPEREKDFWRAMPATWDELVILEAEVSKSAATARHTGDRWYLGAISAVAQKMSLPLDFLDENTQYVAELYQDRLGNDGNNANRDNRSENAELLVANFKVDAQTVLTRQMAFGTGIAAIIRPIEQGEETLPNYTAYQTVYSQLEDLIIECNALEQDTYDPKTWLDMADALASAKSLLADPEASVEDLSAAYDELKTAFDGLVIIREVIRVETNTDTTIQSWKAYNGDEQTRNYGGLNVLRTVSNLSGRYGKYGQSAESVGVSEVDAKISLLKFEIPSDLNIIGGKLSFTGQGVRDNASGNDALAAVRISPDRWQEGNSSGNADVPIGNIGDEATWRHLGTGLNYQFAFDFESEQRSETFNLSGFSGKKVEIDVTDILKGLSGEETVSFAIFETAGKEIYFHSSENNTAANRPALVLYVESEQELKYLDLAVANGSATLTASLKAGEDLAATENAQVILAVYDTDGRLLSVKAENTSIGANLQTEVISADLPENAVQLKAFLWNGDFEPLLAPETLSVE